MHGVFKPTKRVRGASGAIDDRREDEAEADEMDETDATQTPSAATVKRRRVSETSNAGAPVTPVTEPRPARTVAAFAANEDGQPDLIAHAQAESHLELHRTEPRLERVEATPYSDRLHPPSTEFQNLRLHLLRESSHQNK